MQMTATVLPDYAANKGVSWSVNNVSLATITQAGLLNPLANGSVIVTATAMDGSGVTDSETIIISNQLVKVTAITLSTSTGLLTMKKSSNLTIIAAITPSNASNKTVTWSITNNGGTNATINSTTGVLTSKNKTGSVIVSARSNDGSNITATIQIQITL
jgi:uncharacterized protein YjdB